jgi:hypothetical protein
LLRFIEAVAIVAPKPFYECSNLHKRMAKPAGGSEETSAPKQEAQSSKSKVNYKGAQMNSSNTLGQASNQSLNRKATWIY